jgi:hypothetical protein
MSPSSPENTHQRAARAVRSDKGQPRLTERDLDLLRYLGEQTACCFDQVQNWLARHPDSQPSDPTFLSASRTSAILARLQKLGLLTCRKILADDLKWAWCTARGLYHLHLPCRFHEPAVADLDHLFWVNETCALVEASDGARPGFRWESERLIRATRERLRAQQKQEPELWIPPEYRGAHRPDALLRYRESADPEAPEVVCAIETELHRKSYESWRRVFQDLVSYYDEARYYAPAEIRGALLSALERFGREEAGPERRQRIAVYELEAALASEE